MEQCCDMNIQRRGNHLEFFDGNIDFSCFQFIDEFAGKAGFKGKLALGQILR